MAIKTPTEIWDACDRAMRGDRSQLMDLGYAVKTLGDVWRLQASAYNAMTDAERQRCDAQTRAELQRINRRA